MLPLVNSLAITIPATIIPIFLASMAGYALAWVRFRGSDIVFEKGFGSANLEWNIPNSPTTKFRLGSITKQFTAASILLLEERGRLKVEDPVESRVRRAHARTRGRHASSRPPR